MAIFSLSPIACLSIGKILIDIICKIRIISITYYCASGILKEIWDGTHRARAGPDRGPAGGIEGKDSRHNGAEEPAHQDPRMPHRASRAEKRECLGTMHS